MKRARLRPQSWQRAKWNRLYLAALATRKRVQRVCQKCAACHADEGHHPFGRNGDRIMIFVLICQPCHKWIHENAKAARASGWIIDSLMQNQTEAFPVGEARLTWEKENG